MYAILDTINNRIQGYRSGRWVSTTPLPSPVDSYDFQVSADGHRFYIHDNSTIRVLDAAGKMLDAFPYPQVIGPGALFADAPGGKIVLRQYHDGVEYDLEDVRAGKASARQGFNGGMAYQKILVLNPSGRQAQIQADGVVRAKINATSTRTDIAADFLDADRAGNMYVFTNEMLLDVPQAAGESTIRRFNAGGVETGVAVLPNDIAMVPKREIRVKNGTVYVLYPQAVAVKVYQVELGPQYRTKLEEIKQEMQKKWAPFMQPRGSASATPDSGVRMLSSNSRLGLLAYATVTRDEAMYRALDMVNLNWWYGTNNYSPIPPGAARPDWLTALGPAHWAYGIPYAWGGFDSLQTSSVTFRLTCDDTPEPLERQGFEEGAGLFLTFHEGQQVQGGDKTLLNVISFRKGPVGLDS